MRLDMAETLTIMHLAFNYQDQSMLGATKTFHGCSHVILLGLTSPT